MGAPVTEVCRGAGAPCGTRCERARACPPKRRSRHGGRAVWTLRALLALVLMSGGAATAAAGERFAVIVSGASGGEKFAPLQDKWRNDLAAVLKGRFDFADANVVTLDEASPLSGRATAENVRRVFGDLRKRVGRDDLVLLVLFGHGNVDGTEGKFNLVGPDLTAADWKALIEPLAGRVAVVDTTESSFPFLEGLSQKGRVVITATDSAAQRYATVFPEYFIKALYDPAADADKDGRVSMWEAFSAASTGVRTHYEQRGQLSTERPLLDDDGDGIGRESQAPGGDGSLARRLFLDPDRVVPTGDPVVADLQRRRDAVQAQLDELKMRQPLLKEGEYQAELERLLLELARISQQLRNRS